MGYKYVCYNGDRHMKEKMIEHAYEKIFKTDTGKKLCREMFRIFDEKR